jgi:NADPH:quinone reductase-like Zn-dependent oxidoreductase
LALRERQLPQAPAGPTIEQLRESHRANANETEIPRPVPAGRDLLVRVNAISVNLVDTKIRRGRGGEETSLGILGCDVAEVIEATGNAVAPLTVTQATSPVPAPIRSSSW